MITPLLLFYLHKGFVWIERQHFIEYVPKKSFNIFVLSAVEARWQSDENSISSVVAETLKLLVNSPHGYQIKDRSQHTVTK